MSVIILLMVCSISIAAVFLGAFVWNIRKGQYDDETAPPVRMLFEDPRPVTSFTADNDKTSNQTS